MSCIPLRNIKLTLSYDGTRFAGWQRQDRKDRAVRTVQGEVERALAKIHKEHIPLTGSGRTDSGVHAVGQVANFYTDIASIPACRFVQAINALLPQDVRVLASEEAPESFNARFDARERTYRYFLHCSAQVAAHELPYCWPLFRRPNIQRLNEMAGLLNGELDCTSFAAAGDKSASKSRFLYGASFFPEGDKLIFEISANAFLWKMVRTVLGTLLELEKKDEGAELFRRVIESRDRRAAGMTAPAKGLFLWNVRY